MFIGCGTAMVTPFHSDGSLDEPTLRKLIQRQIDAGIDFLVPCGTTGESPTLTHEEHLRVVEITVGLAKGRVPVLAGAGGYNTAEVIALARELAVIGADGLLSGDSVLQQADAGRLVPTLSRDRERRVAANHFVQRARTHGRKHRARHCETSRRNREHHWH